MRTLSISLLLILSLVLPAHSEIKLQSSQYNRKNCTNEKQLLGLRASLLRDIMLISKLVETVPPSVWDYLAKEMTIITNLPSELQSKGRMRLLEQNKYFKPYFVHVYSYTLLNLLSGEIDKIDPNRFANKNKSKSLAIQAMHSVWAYDVFKSAYEEYLKADLKRTNKMFNISTHKRVVKTLYKLGHLINVYAECAIKEIK